MKNKVFAAVLLVGLKAGISYAQATVDLGIQTDAAVLAPAETPFYTHSSGTSVATPHTAGIVALILEAKPSLSPAQVKAILQKTATNMPGRESWEVGAG